MFLFETLGGWSEPRWCGSSADEGQSAEQADQTAGRAWSELVDVDVARAAVTAPLGGGAHSFGVGDRDSAAARWGWGRGALL